ncbi:putative DCC family thiol-disulfide oxidoreductase YuxK [Natronocella acetinitrilica]|uniref:DCC family thiol-disulfide oxidoreductase YuxK n=1 Tax=Natronocella acetinitrilica TaxID=414046 RepID=A0AAE3KCV8_9GAMM|nr:DUF393 domain-containing protein [Natronocella acetinitrilica]MCP1675513.1 putative DCC family thiol-disulfide oxidoreductase YuxK [Natronocella acetinitrilica]
MSTPRRPVVFYDGGCPICRREIAHYRRLDRNDAIDWRDIVAEPEALDGTGVDWDTAMRRFHALDEQGRLRSGVDGFAMVWAQLPYWRWLARVVRGLGLLRPLEALYRWYAPRRYARRCPID